MSDTVMSDAVISDTVMSDAVISDAVISDAVISDAVISDAVAIYARVPEPGKTKTRLRSALSSKETLGLYEAFVRDTFRTAREADAATTIWLTGAREAALDLFEGWPLAWQDGLDLGARLEGTVRRALTESARVVVIGTDAPTLPARLVRSGLRALDDHDFVLGPSADGGYYLIGARRGLDGLLEGVRWSTSSTLADSASRLRSQGSLALLPPWYDIDVPSDLEILRTHLRLDPAAAPHTARFLGLGGNRP
ncbi:MAG: TIGR04282 family arsenosugar biosynthesis glycosyltransferase [Myxococcota bacterium]